MNPTSAQCGSAAIYCIPYLARDSLNEIQVSLKRVILVLITLAPNRECVFTQGMRGILDGSTAAKSERAAILCYSS